MAQLPVGKEAASAMHLRASTRSVVACRSERRCLPLSERCHSQPLLPEWLYYNWSQQLQLSEMYHSQPLQLSEWLLCYLHV